MPQQLGYVVIYLVGSIAVFPLIPVLPHCPYLFPLINLFHLSLILSHYPKIVDIPPLLHTLETRFPLTSILLQSRETCYDLQLYIYVRFLALLGLYPNPFSGPWGPYPWLAGFHLDF